MTHEKIVVLDFGTNTAQTVARKVRVLHVYSQIKPYTISRENLLNLEAKGIVLSEMPESFPLDTIAEMVSKLETLKIPILGNIDHPVFAILLEANKTNLHILPLEDEKDVVLHDWLYKTCKLTGDWSMKSFLTEEVERIKKLAAGKKVLCGLSGGVDSSVAATLVHRAVGENLACVFVDHGLMRKDEGKQVVKLFREELNMNLIAVDAGERFLSQLSGVSDPEKKRKIIGTEFIRVFEEEAAKLGTVDFLVQGTLYPDIVESSGATGEVIKSHHNVGGLPEDMKFELIEPLRELFKDEVRELGLELGLPEQVVYRQPFPGPGLGIRVLGEITKEKLEILREADYIMRNELAKAGLERAIWQSFTVLPDIRSVGQLEGKRTYCHTIVVRAVNSADGMTAQWVQIPFEVLERISNAITTELPIVNRVVYDITSKPPATIEWE